MNHFQHAQNLMSYSYFGIPSARLPKRPSSRSKSYELFILYDPFARLDEEIMYSAKQGFANLPPKFLAPFFVIISIISGTKKGAKKTLRIICHGF